MQIRFIMNSNPHEQLRQWAIEYGTDDESLLLPRNAEEAVWFEKADRIQAQVPFCVDWVEYKGEVVFAAVDYEKSVACGRPIIEVSYCATQWLNRNIMGCHNYSPETFKKCKISSWK